MQDNKAGRASGNMALICIIPLLEGWFVYVQAEILWF